MKDIETILKEPGGIERPRDMVLVNAATQSPSNVLLTLKNLDLHGYKLQNGMHMKTQQIILFKYLPFYLNKSDNHDS